MQFGTIRKRNAGLEHRGIIGRFGPCEFKIGLAQPIERSKWLRAAIVPRLLEHNRKPLEPAQRDAGEKFITIAEMAIGRGWTHARPPRGLGKGETGRSFLRNQFQGGAQKRFFQIAMVIAPGTTALVFRPAHVNSFYMSCRASSREF